MFAGFFFLQRKSKKGWVIFYGVINIDRWAQYGSTQGSCFRGFQSRLKKQQQIIILNRARNHVKNCRVYTFVYLIPVDRACNASSVLRCLR